jgi:hypothetical protein
MGGQLQIQYLIENGEQVQVVDMNELSSAHVVEQATAPTVGVCAADDSYAMTRIVVDSPDKPATQYKVGCDHHLWLRTHIDDCVRTTSASSTTATLFTNATIR